MTFKNTSRSNKYSKRGGDDQGGHHRDPAEMVSPGDDKPGGYSRATPPGEGLTDCGGSRRPRLADLPNRNASTFEQLVTAKQINLNDGADNTLSRNYPTPDREEINTHTTPYREENTQTNTNPNIDTTPTDMSNTINAFPGMAGQPRASAQWRPKTSPIPGHRNRNTKRGIRSKQKQAERKEKRTEKRRHARQEHRNKKPWTGIKLWNWETLYKKTRPRPRNPLTK